MPDWNICAWLTASTNLPRLTYCKVPYLQYSTYIKLKQAIWNFELHNGTDKTITVAAEHGGDLFPHTLHHPCKYYTNEINLASENFLNKFSLHLPGPN